MTLSDATLEALRRESAAFTSTAEHPADAWDSLAQRATRTERLHSFGMTCSVYLAHCISHRRPGDGSAGETVSHQPRSNMKQRRAQGCAADVAGVMAVCLGNDGFSNDMFTEMKVADLLQQK